MGVQEPESKSCCAPGQSCRASEQMQAQALPDKKRWWNKVIEPLRLEKTASIVACNHHHLVKEGAWELKWGHKLLDSIHIKKQADQDGVFHSFAQGRPNGYSWPRFGGLRSAFCLEVVFLLMSAGSRNQERATGAHLASAHPSPSACWASQRKAPQ